MSLSSKGTRKTFPDKEITADADASAQIVAAATYFELAQRVIPVDEVPGPVDL